MPNFDRTKVDPNRLSVTAGNIESSLSMLSNAFNAIDNALSNDLQPTWSDIASSQFFQQYALDKSNFQSQIKALQKLNAQLQEAAGLYDTADTKANDLVNKLKIG